MLVKDSVLNDPGASIGDTTNTMSSHKALVKKNNSDHAPYSNSRTTTQSRSCGNFDRKRARSIYAKTVQNSSGMEIASSSLYSGSGEYYKRYDYDAVPIRDDVTTSQTSTASGKGEMLPLTASHLHTLENNIPQDLKTDSSNNTLDSSIKFFKVTVEEIFAKFYANMKDFQLYKKRFHEILAKDQEQCVDEMEHFIKDMIHHIMSTESTAFDSNCLCEFKNKVPVAKTVSDISSKIEDLQCVMEAFKNENYPIESVSDDKGSGTKQEWKGPVTSSETFNIYLTSRNPCVKIKMNSNRNHLSEIHIVDRSNKQALYKALMSADNINKLTAKDFNTDMSETPADTADLTDREIPVKNSFAKKNIHSDKEGDGESKRTEKSFIAKLCTFLCTKIRKAVNLGM